MEQKELATFAAKIADEKHAENIVLLEMDGISLIADYFLICHGNSEKQVQAIAEAIKEEVSSKGIDVKRMEGFHEGRWILIDLGAVIVHVFHKDERNYYNLEKLWGDAPRIQYENFI